jgi:hypothetical protein
MVVRTQNKGSHVTGLNVGANNVQRYFSKDILTIELQLGHLRIQCLLEPDFWQKRPEIHHPRLCTWLEFKYPYGKPDRPPALLTMIISESNSFRIEPMPLDVHIKATDASGNYRQLDIIEGLPAQLPPVPIPPSLGFRAVLL